VIRRAANQLTVKGATLFRSNGSVSANDRVEVLLGDNTKVSKQLSAAFYDIVDISVGQYVTVFGTLNGDQTELDASEGYVRMHLTTLNGEVAHVDSGLYVSVDAINARDINLFDFSGTGLDPANDANPAEYHVGTGVLNLSGIGSGTALKCRGFVTSFGHAANVADFEAVTLVDVSDVKGLMVVDWAPSSTSALDSITANSLSVNLTNAGNFHRLNRAGVITDLTQLPGEPVVKPQSGGIGLFIIHENNGSQLFFTFNGFSEELLQRLHENAAVKLIAAKGQFDNTTKTMTANWVAVHLDD
jgi:hypothetical protein